MNIILDKYAPSEIKHVIEQFDPEIAALGSASFWIRTDDDAILAFIVVKDIELKVNLNNIQSNIVNALEMTRYVYTAVIGQPTNGLMLSIQELGSFTSIVGSVDDLVKMINFVADPKRRSVKRLAPSRNVSMFTALEQILLAIPGVGPKTLGSIMAFFGVERGAWALSALTNYDTADFGLIGIDATEIDKFRDILGLEDHQILSVIEQE